MTRFGWSLSGTVLAALLVVVFCPPGARLAVLSALCTASGLWIGLGVSFPSWQMFGQSLCQGPADQNRVALTFDDGPDPETTPRLLELLARHRVRAAFFGIGWRVARHPDLARRIVAEGHLLENHSHAHSSWTNLFGAARLRADLLMAQETISKATGRAPSFYRPPMGLTNHRVFPVARDLGLRVTGYSARGLDRRRHPPERIVARIERRLRPGAIVLLHDGGVPAEGVLAVTGMLIDKLQTLGYECVRLDELIADNGSS